ncbi:hypothetical protein [Brevundimonas sp. LjRoot202]|uniref:hypothetical protein n=1 Tax=Brevundimonas sp. LjRoot202 TaxID=3342281 RepID=UPI003ECD0354
MIIWSGWGFLVAIFFLVGCLIGLPVAGLVSTDPDVNIAVTILVGGLVAGLSSFLFARKVEGGEGRAFIDEATGQRVVVRRTAGSLFFIPTRYWAYVAPVLAIALAVVMMMPTATDTAAAAAVETAPADASAPAN